MYNDYPMFNAFSPLNDDPLRGEREKQSPQQFGHNELTYAQGAYDDHWELPQPYIFAMAINSIGFMPLLDRASYVSVGGQQNGPWTGQVPDWADGYAFPDLTGGMVKVRG